MGEEISNLQPEKLIMINKDIANEPIKIPDNLFIAKFKDLGVDEILAAFVDPASTTAARAAFPEANWLLSASGPIAEKFIFFARHALEAKGIYKTTRPQDRKDFNFYLRERLRHGAGNVTKDIIYHDPIYAGLMALEIALFPEVHPAFLSIADYVVSVPIAVGIDVFVDYARHQKKMLSLKSAGFTTEKYYESRFFVSNEKNHAEALEKLIREFNLEYTGSATYQDRYFDINKEGLSGRQVKMRLRNRTLREHERKMWAKESEDFNEYSTNMLQVIYTRAQEDKDSKPDQCRYYPVLKEKAYAVVNNNATTLDEITNKHIRNAGRKFTISDKISKPIIFGRDVAGSSELAVCTDSMHNTGRPFYVLELKVYNDTRQLREAQRFVMVELPIVAKQTTYGKADMFL